MLNEPYIIISSPVNNSKKEKIKIFISITWKKIKDFLVGKPKKKKKSLLTANRKQKKNQRKGTLGMKTFLLVGTKVNNFFFYI